MEHEILTGRIIGAAMRVHRVLGPGFLEKVYVNALAHEFGKRGIAFQRGVWIRVYYDNAIVGDNESDLFVEKLVVVECKATRTLVDRNVDQLMNCFTAIRQEIGLLLNFGSDRLQFRRKTRVYLPNTT